jgi:hypothetical protein
MHGSARAQCHFTCAHAQCIRWPPRPRAVDAPSAHAERTRQLSATRGTLSKHCLNEVDVTGAVCSTVAGVKGRYVL